MRGKGADSYLQMLYERLSLLRQLLTAVGSIPPRLARYWANSSGWTRKPESGSSISRSRWSGVSSPAMSAHLRAEARGDQAIAGMPRIENAFLLPPSRRILSASSSPSPNSGRGNSFGNSFPSTARQQQIAFRSDLVLALSRPSRGPFPLILRENSWSGLP